MKKTERLAISILLASSAFACRRSPGVARPAGRGLSAPVESSDVLRRAARPPGGRAPVIWIGLDGLDWELMDRLSAEGKVPNWSRLVAEGASAKLASFVPVLSPVVWTTIATGVGPDVHRVLDFQEVDPSTGLKVPISGFSRAVPAVWNIASASGVRVGVVGWWATHPAEIVDGFFVSDRASPILFSASSAPGVAFPPALDSMVALIGARDGAVGPQDLSGYLQASPGEISRELSSGQGMENPVVALARILGATRVTQRIARELYDREHPDLTAVYFEGTDEIGHVFAPETPPRLPCATEAGYARDHLAAGAYFEAVDGILGQWMRRAKEDGATLIVSSDHGFKWGSDRTCERSSLQFATAAYWHRIDGVFAAWGSRVLPGRDRLHPSVFDLAPTVLALLDLPADKRMKGKPISAFRGLLDSRREGLFDLAVRRVAAAPVSAAGAAEYAKKLRALGYLSGGDAGPGAPPPGGRPGLTEGAWNNLGLYEREVTGNLDAAESDFRKSLSIRPDYGSPIFNLAILYRKRGDDTRALEWLFRSLAQGHADPAGTVLAWASEYRSARKPGPERILLEKASSLYPDREDLARALAELRFRSKDCGAAWEAVARFEALTAHFETLNQLALLQTCLGRRDRALELFRRSLALNPAQPRVVESMEILEAR